MLADDDEDDRLIFSDAVKEIDSTVKVETVVNGEALMKHLFSRQDSLPDILFLDINMPRKNGFECLREIKGNEVLRNTPIVMFSTSSSPAHIKEAHDEGANLYLQKPSTFTEIKRLLTLVLSISPEEIASQPPIDNFFVGSLH